ncbi:MAG: hypothetical protein IBJ12_07490 [Sphingomonadaceae bacterium]|nr:hypothetical protein [Sphingomonadaceae bacterium]
MPYEGEFATGESLLSLERSEALREFQGSVRKREEADAPNPAVLTVPRNSWMPNRVVAVDGSTINVPVDNGFPMADVSLLKVALVSIDLSKLNLREREIPSPRVFYEMERAHTFDKVLPGANIIRPNVQGDTPKDFFREVVQETLEGKIGAAHESLIDTVRAITANRERVGKRPRCPVEDCENELGIGEGRYECGCERKAALYEADIFRFSERFSDVSSNGEAHGEVRHLVEVLSLVNVLRFFASKDETLGYLRDNVFILDGPLALFGHAAWLAPYVRDEICRINDKCRNKGFDLAVFGVEKSGAFVEHFNQIDMTPEGGPRSKYAKKTAIALEARYINRNIALRPEDAKPHGKDTYFGRKVLYKTATGDHAVITTAIANEASRDLYRNDEPCYPRVGDILNVLDHLATYLYTDGFMPLVRANAHAAIPLRRGTDIIHGLFDGSHP